MRSESKRHTHKFLGLSVNLKVPSPDTEPSTTQVEKSGLWADRIWSQDGYRHHENMHHSTRVVNHGIRATCAGRLKESDSTMSKPRAPRE